MVKKKAPVIPLTIVCIGIAVIFGVNMQQHPKDPKAEQQAPKEQSGMRPADKQSDLNAAIKGSGIGQSPQMMRPKSLATGGASLMSAKKPEPYKPKPSATGTDSAWYVKR